MAERFDAWMERCLYDPSHGFYTGGGGSAGRRRGDFITSPEVGPLFAQVVARALDQWWVEAGRPDPFPVYDVGTGPGTLAAGLQRAGGVGAASRRVAGLDRGDELPRDLEGSVVVANELLDNLPVRVLERSEHGWLEVWVDGGPTSASGLAGETGETRETGEAASGTAGVSGTAGDPRSGVVEVLRPLDAADAHLVPASCHDLPVGARIPLLAVARQWVADVLARGPEALLVFDYGTATTVELGRRGGWLRTYRHHERGDDPYHQPGRWDITTDIALDQLPGPTVVEDQASFLHRFGIGDLVAEGRAHWAAHAARPDLTALAMRSRVTEAEALLDPTGLGSWLVCTWRP